MLMLSIMVIIAAKSAVKGSIKSNIRATGMDKSKGMSLWISYQNFGELGLQMLSLQDVLGRHFFFVSSCSNPL